MHCFSSQVNKSWVNFVTQCPYDDAFQSVSRVNLACNATLVVAAGEIRLLYSKTLVNKASKAARNGPITVRGVAGVLERHLGVAECGVFTYLSDEADVTVLIAPKVTRPTFTQVRWLFVLET